MAIDPKLVSIKTVSELPTAVPTSAGQFFFFEGNQMKKAPMTDIYDKVSAGIKGVATTSTVPSATGFERYLVHTAGTYTNFKGAGNVAIVVSAGDLDVVDGIANNDVILEVNNGVATKRVVRRKGDTGKSIVSIAKTATVGVVDTYTITYSDATTTTFTVTNAVDVSDYNITTSVPLTVGSYYTLQTAIEAVPLDIRRIGMNLHYLSGSFETETFVITTGAKTAGDLIITLDGNDYNITLLAGDTPVQVADKIRTKTISGWIVGGTIGTDRVTIKSLTVGKKISPKYLENGTGVIGYISPTIVGENERWNNIQFNGSTIASWTSSVNWNQPNTITDIYNIEITK